VPFARPLQRTREYVDIVRLALAREPVTYQGEHHVLPLPDGPGKTLRLMLRPQRDIPLYLAAVGPRNLELTGELADGWLGIFFAPERAALFLEPLRAGAERAGRRLADLDVTATVPVAVGGDLEACADQLRGYTALYVGGMGSRTQNFYNALAQRLGFEAAASRIQELYLDGRPREAAAAVPLQLIDQTALIGPAARIAERVAAYAEAGVTTLSVSPAGPTYDDRRTALRTVAEAWSGSGAGD
jgi:F420-dependent oxidoreductase-like protein